VNHGDLIAKMSLEEKISFVTGDGFWYTRGIPRLGIPSIYLTDGPHGLRKLADGRKSADFVGVLPATCFPTASLLASSFDPELAFEMGRALGEECRLGEVAMLLGPGVNIKRSPLCGRNFEYFTEDPLLSSAMGAAWIAGVESTGVGASLKHFAVNSQEGRRMTVDVVVDPRALREIYLASFEGAVREGRPSSVMGAYNSVNGVHCCENPFLLDQVLRAEWGFEGFVVTDWGAAEDRARGLASGCDLEMPQGRRGSAGRIRSALASGELDAAALDRAVDRILSFVLRAARTAKVPAVALAGSPASAAVPAGTEGLAEGPTPTATFIAPHHELARRIAAESMVLLKNEDDILPLSKSGPLAVIGELARTPRYQGAGSSTIVPTRLESLLDALGEAGIPFEFEAAYALDDELPVPALEESALALARRVGLAGGTLIYAIGLPPIFESEGFDRERLDLPANQTALFEALAAACPRIVAFWSGGAPVTTDWSHHVRALLAAYLGGQASGAAVRDILFGDANPAGKLAESWPLRLEDTPAYGNYSCSEDRVLYKEGIFIGYRWYASSGRPVRFPFGYGLSYTSFSYADIALDRSGIDARGTVELSFTLTNVGERRGREIAQVYLSFPDSEIERPAISLSAFRKIGLEAGESRRVAIRLGPRELRYWDADQGSFLVESGPVLVHVGPSSAELPLEAIFHVEGGASPVQHGPRLDLGSHPSAMSDLEFAQRYGSALPLPRDRSPFGPRSTLADMAEESALVRLLYRIMVAVQTKASGTKRGEANHLMIERMVGEMPLGRFESMSGGAVGPRFLGFLADLANHRRLRALLGLIGGAASSPDPFQEAKPSRRTRRRPI